ncbi:hypothetical protein ACJJTC_006688 [Scirpophaga incertulas]
MVLIQNNIIWNIYYGLCFVEVRLVRAAYYRRVLWANNDQSLNTGGPYTPSKEDHCGEIRSEGTTLNAAASIQHGGLVHNGKARQAQKIKDGWAAVGEHHHAEATTTPLRQNS